MSRYIYLKIPRVKNKVKIKILPEVYKDDWPNAFCSKDGMVSFNTAILKASKDYQIIALAHELGHRACFKKNIMSPEGRLVWEEALADYYALQKCGMKRLNIMYDGDMKSYRVIKSTDPKEYRECIKETVNRRKLVLKWHRKKLTFIQAFDRCRKYWL